MKTFALNPLLTRAGGQRAPLQGFSGQLVGAVPSPRDPGCAEYRSCATGASHPQSRTDGCFVGAVPSPRDWTRSQRRAFPLRLLPAVLILLGGGCGTAPIRPFQRPATAGASFEAQTRRFDGISREAMLTACAALLQDLGFMIEEADSTLGVISGRKNRTAVEQNTAGGVLLEATATVALFLALGMLTGGVPSAHSEDPSDRQVIRATFTVEPASSESPDRVLVSLTLNRVIYSKGNKEMKSESVHEPELVRGFFEALAKSVFLEAQLQ